MKQVHVLSVKAVGYNDEEMIIDLNAFVMVMGL